MPGPADHHDPLHVVGHDNEGVEHDRDVGRNLVPACTVSAAPGISKISARRRVHAVTKYAPALA
jgi:hypothetical protein